MSINSDPNFAIICTFFEKFSELCGLERPDTRQLKEWLENSEDGKCPQRFRVSHKIEGKMSVRFLCGLCTRSRTELRLLLLLCSACGKKFIFLHNSNHMLLLSVHPELVDIHLKLMRKLRKVVTPDKWERGLIKFCYTSISNQDAWEIERFGYKKASLPVKLRILKVSFSQKFSWSPCKNHGYFRPFWRFNLTQIQNSKTQ